MADRPKTDSGRLREALASGARLAAIARFRAAEEEPAEALLCRAAHEAARLFGAPEAAVNVLRGTSFVAFRAAGGAGEACTRQEGLVCGAVVEAAEALYVPDVAADERFRECPITAHCGARSFLGVPLRGADGRPMGALCVLAPEPGAFEAAWAAELAALADRVSDALGQADRLAELRLRLAELECENLTDAVTGLANRRGLEEAAQREFALARRHGRPLSVLFLDLDLFKRVNDACGHAAGDEALAEVGRRLRASLRASDTAGRYGGDEFVAVLPETDGADAAGLARRIAREVRVQVRPACAEVTLTAGAATWPDDPAASAGDLLTIADRRLLEQKAARRRAAPQEGGVP